MLCTRPGMNAHSLFCSYCSHLRMSFQGATSQLAVLSSSLQTAGIQSTQSGAEQPATVQSHDTHKHAHHGGLCEVRVGDQEESHLVELGVAAVGGALR